MALVITQLPSYSSRELAILSGQNSPSCTQNKEKEVTNMEIRHLECTDYNNRDIGSWNQGKLNAVCAGNYLGENQRRQCISMLQRGRNLFQSKQVQYNVKHAKGGGGAKEAFQYTGCTTENPDTNQLTNQSTVCTVCERTFSRSSDKKIHKCITERKTNQRTARCR